MSGDDAQPKSSILPLKSWTLRLLFCSFAALIGTSFMTGFAMHVFIKLSAVSPENPANFTEPSAEKLRRRIESASNTKLLPIIAFCAFKLIAFLGPSAALANRFGRGKTLLIGSVVGGLAFVVYLISFNILNLHRFSSRILYTLACAILGFQSGNGLVVAPAYLVEIAPNSARGSVGALYEIFYWAGVALAFTTEIDTFDTGKILLNIFAGLSLFIFAVHFVMLLFVDESPRWLFEKKRQEAAVGALSHLRNCSEEEAGIQLEALKPLTVADDAPVNEDPQPECCCGKVKRLAWPMFLGASVMTANYLTGAHLVYLLLTAMIKSRVWTSNNMQGPGEYGFPVIFAAILIVVYIGLMIGCALLVDRIGRRRLLVTGLTAMTLAYIPMAIGVLWKVPLLWQIGSVALMVGFSIGPAPIAAFLVAEMFDQQSRLFAMSACHLVTQIFPVAWMELFSVDYYWYGARMMPSGIVFCVLETILLLVFLPETKQIPIDQAAAKFQLDGGKPRAQFKLTFTTTTNSSSSNNDDGTAATTTTSSRKICWIHVATVAVVVGASIADLILAILLFVKGR